MMGEDGMVGQSGRPRERSVRCLSPGGHHRMVYDDYGPDMSTHAVVCVHGLTRNGRDFERLARQLARDGRRVLCPDIVGRGRSEPLGQGGEYGTPQYLADLTVMLAHAEVDSVDWIGTSMGGLIGMALAAMPGHPIRRMAINDVGPRVPKQAMRRIAEYVGETWRFDDFDEGVAHVKKAYEPFGLREEEDWRYLAEISLKPEADGRYTNNYDLRIAEPFRAVADADADLWGFWDAMDIASPPLVLRGESSDVLLAEDLEEMKARGPGARPVTIAGCGHAPTLMVPEQIDLIREWLGERDLRARRRA